MRNVTDIPKELLLALLEAAAKEAPTSLLSLASSSKFFWDLYNHPPKKLALTREAVESHLGEYFAAAQTSGTFGGQGLFQTPLFGLHLIAISCPMAETELPTASSTFDVQKDLRRQAEGKKWDSRALRLQDAIIRNPRVDYLAGILEEESGDEGEDNDAYTEVVALFEDFNLPPVRTMSILQRLRGYMSGSGVLATERRRLDLPSFEPKDLDFYLQEQASHCFRDFLLESGERQFWKEVDFTKRSDLATGLSEEHAYTAGDTTWTASGSQSEGISKKEGQLRISKLWYFRDARGKEINVIVTASRCALVPIVAFHSMPVMNFVTYFGIVSLYGSLTELGLGWVNRDLKSKPLSPQDQEWLDKYADRGYLLSGRFKHSWAFQGSSMPAG
ncbi:hypothetical protein BKA70DRAFT_1504729 [Coprinopsis sp. MPI-PUGE-AT-0042]|nr:hypothetical protein BKA70DRAFT_1504729 [Coprinopsis sp. MPI-PUGE-AT-0042]